MRSVIKRAVIYSLAEWSKCEAEIKSDVGNEIGMGPSSSRGDGDCGKWVQMKDMDTNRQRKWVWGTKRQTDPLNSEADAWTGDQQRISRCHLAHSVLPWHVIWMRQLKGPSQRPPGKDDVCGITWTHLNLSFTAQVFDCNNVLISWIYQSNSCHCQHLG